MLFNINKSTQYIPEKLVKLELNQEEIAF